MKKTLIFILLIVGLSGCKTNDITPQGNSNTYTLTNYGITDLRTYKSVENVTGTATFEIGKSVDMLLLNGSTVIFNENMKFTQIEQNGIVTFSNNNENRGTLYKSSGIMTFQFDATVKQGYNCKFTLSFKRL